MLRVCLYPIFLVTRQYVGAQPPVDARAAASCKFSGQHCESQTGNPIGRALVITISKMTCTSNTYWPRYSFAQTVHFAFWLTDFPQLVPDFILYLLTNSIVIQCNGWIHIA